MKGVNMKKFLSKYIALIIVIIFIGLFVLLGILSGKQTIKIDSEEISSWYQDTKSNQYVLTVLAQTTCSHCHNYKPVIEEVASSNNLKLHFINIDTLTNNDRNVVENTYDLKDFEGTPHTLITKNGELLKEISGENTKTRIESALKVVGAIENN